MKYIIQKISIGYCENDLEYTVSWEDVMSSSIKAYIVDKYNELNKKIDGCCYRLVSVMEE